MTKEGLRETLQKHIDEVFREFMDDNDIKTGDISPLQAFDLEQRIDGLTELIFVVCEQNRERVYTKEEVIKYFEGHLEDSERYLIDGNTIKLYLE